MKVELTALRIKVGEATLEISIQEAKALYRQLHDLFGERLMSCPNSPVVINTPTWFPPRPPLSPQWITAPRTGDPLPAFPTITCQARAWNEDSKR